MSLSYRVASLPDAWPGGARTAAADRERPKFKTIWTRALDLLDREVYYLDGSNVEIAVDVAPTMLRNDGQLRADARPRSAAVVVSFDTPTGRLVFAADRYTYWQENVDAIARSLEKMRAVDRYGVLQGKHYQGFKAIAATSTPTMSVQEAARFIGDLAPADPVAVMEDREYASSAIRSAMRKAHPDVGGKPEAWHRLQLARSVLDAHFGGPR